MMYNKADNVVIGRRSMGDRFTTIISNIKGNLVAILFILLSTVMFLSACAPVEAPDPAVSSTVTLTATRESTLTPTLGVTATPSPTNTPTPAPTPTPSPTPTITPTPLNPLTIQSLRDADLPGE